MLNSSWRLASPPVLPGSSTICQATPDRSSVVMRSNRCLRMNWQPEGMSLNQLKERGCSSLEEYISALEARRQKRDALNDYVARTDISGQEKGWARCDYIFKNLRLPFQCSTCWLLPGHCICNSLHRYQVSTKVVIHLHPDEWAKGSNTGCLCSSLSDCELLMKGHKPHDERLQQLLDDPHYTCAILWPGDDALEPRELQQLAAERSEGRIALMAVDATWDGARKMRSKYPPGVHMLKLPPHLALPTHTQQPAVPTAAMAASDATSAGVSTIPSSPTAAGYQNEPPQLSKALQTLSACATAECSVVGPPFLQLQDGFPDSQAQQQQKQHQQHQRQCAGSDHVHDGSSKHPHASSIPVTAASGKPSHSLFRPLRKYHGNATENGRVCTVEAVAAALLALEGDADMYEGLLYNLKLKVDAMRRQKHVGEVYGTGAAVVLAEEP